MTTSELVKALAERMAISQREARTVLDGYAAAIIRQLSINHSVSLRNFGSFSIKTVAEKRAYLPALRSLCLIPAHQKLEFKAAKKLREEVNREVSGEQGQ